MKAFLAAACALIAAMTFMPAFAPGNRFPVILAGTVALVTVTAVALSLTKLSRTVRLALTILALALYVGLVVAPGLSVHSGAKRLLTAGLPVDPQGPELATVAVLAGLATLAAVEPVLRRRHVLLALPAPVVLAIAGSAVSAPAGNPPLWTGPAFAIAAGLLLFAANRSAANRTATNRPSPRRPTASPGAPTATAPSSAAPSSSRAPLWLRGFAAITSLVLLAGLALAATAAPLLLRDSDPFAARSLMAQPVTPRLDVSPLALFPALRSGRRPLALTVSTSSPTPLMRFATLDRFDGTFWTTDARYRLAGRHLGAPGGQTREEEVQVLRDDGLGWLVSSGRPVFVSVSGLGADDASGDVVIPQGQAPPKSYTVRSAVVTPPASGDSPVAATAECAPELADWAVFASGGTRDAAGLTRIVAHLREYTLDGRVEAPGGHGLFQVRQLRQNRVGTAEQFASAFALLARCLGMRARVAVGFRPRLVRPGEYAVTGEDVHAWAEVRYSQAGWVPFDPTPAVAESDITEPAPEPSQSPEPSVSRSAPPPFTAPTGQALPPSLAPGQDPASQNILIGLVLIFVLVAAIPGAKTARRFARRRVGSPDRRALAAWHETLDRLAEADVHTTTAHTSGEVTALAAARFSPRVAAPLGQLAKLHDAAIYAPLFPPSGPRDAWRLAQQIRAAVAAELTRGRRMLTRFDPRALLRRNTHVPR